MFCSHCGIKIEGMHIYCPNCGERIPVRDAKKRMPLWLRLLIGTAFIAIIVSFFFYLVETDPKDVIVEQLSALKNQQLTEAYYGYTAHDFQEATSLEKFKEVIRAFPYLMEVKNLEVIKKEEKGSFATLRVALTTEKNIPFLMEYQLVNEDGNWKVVYFKLIREPTHAVLEETDPEKIVRDTLKLLKLNQIEKAYNTTTSNEFKETTSLEEFEAFLKKNPLLTTYQTYFTQDSEQIDTIQRVTFVLKNEQEEKKVEYSLVKEEGDWKILGIKVLDFDQKVEEKTDHSVIKTPSEVYFDLMENFLIEVSKGNSSEAWSRYTTQEFQSASPLSEFQKSMETYPFFINFQKLEVLNLKTEKDFASIKTRLISDGGEIGNVQFDFIRENNQWKIHQILIFKTPAPKLS